MRANGHTLGGEQSGHIIDLHRNTTGDGPRTAISLFSTIERAKKTLHDLASDLTVYPQILVNVRTSDKEVLRDPDVMRAIEEAEAILTGNGRLLIRPSGTEPLIRVMVEGDDQSAIEALAQRVAGRIQQAASASAQAAEYNT